MCEFIVFYPWYCVDCPFVVVKVNGDGDEWGDSSVLGTS